MVSAKAEDGGHEALDHGSVLVGAGRMIWVERLAEVGSRSREAHFLFDIDAPMIIIVSLIDLMFCRLIWFLFLDKMSDWLVNSRLDLLENTLWNPKVAGLIGLILVYCLGLWSIWIGQIRLDLL